MSKKSDFAIISATVAMNYKVCFDKELTREEAMQAFLDGEYDDILDEDLQEILTVEDAEL